jgi:general nucleoside transport system ATP-binding protein
MPARALSGGNQQKLVLARELDGQPSLLVVDNPTRGLDILAAADVHRRLARAREAGTAVVFYSSDLDEVIALSDRIVVIAQGTVREIDPPFDRDAVGRRMLGMSA